MVLDESGIYGCPPTADAAPLTYVITGQPVVVTPGATNVTGGDIVLAPSPGEQTLEGVTKAGTTGDTLTFDVYIDGALTSPVKTEGSASPDGWDCDGAATDIECVCNLYDLLTGAGAITGVTVTRTDATCSDEKLTFSITPGAAEYLVVTTSDDTNLDMTTGASGQVLVPEVIDLQDTEIRIRADTELQSSSVDLRWNGATTINGGAVDGYITVSNSAGTVGYTLRNSGGNFYIRNLADSALTDAYREAATMPLPAEAGTRVSMAHNLGMVLQYKHLPAKGVLGTVVMVRTAEGDTTTHNGHVFAKWDDGSFFPVLAQHLQVVAGQRTANNNYRRIASGFGDLGDFLRVAGASSDLVHKATKDLWSFRNEGGNMVLERLFNDTGEPLKV